jgi:RNA polymerase sigma-70 factor (ECF subfamily)
MDVDWRFRALYEREFQAVFRTVYLLCRRRDLAEEATQEAFARAWERWRRLQDRPWAAGWVTTTALNAARRAIRRERAPSFPASPEGADADATLDVWRAVARLPVRQQQALVLHYRLGLPTPDVAAAMRCRVSTVRAYLTRAREALRPLLEEVVDGTRTDLRAP